MTVLSCGSSCFVGPRVGHRLCLVCFIIFCGSNISREVKARTFSPLSKKHDLHCLQSVLKSRPEFTIGG
jgi:hypothetical protein